MKPNYNKLAFRVFVVGIFLRVLLFILNPPDNAFDRHFEPILFIMDHGYIPPKDACMQCYHPPIFYWISAMIGNLASHIGLQLPSILKLLQFINCFYGIMTLGVIYLILNKFRLSEISIIIAFGTACFLPRHIYMSAINSNDTIAYLCVAICIYLLIITVERKFSLPSLVALSITVTITLFTKYTSFVVIPIVFAVFLAAFVKRIPAGRKKNLLAFIGVIVLPLSFLSIYAISNLKNYHNPLPWNLNVLDPSVTQPRDDEPVDFITFKPWDNLRTPILVPGKMHSFWTLIHNGMWFDTEPKFIYFMDSNPQWWEHYYSWLRGEKKFPGNNPPMSIATKFEGSGLIILGLFPLIFTILGGYYYFSGRWHLLTGSDTLETIKTIIFPVLFISNALGVIVITLRLPTYTAMKASYFLSSMPAFAFFMAVGLMACENLPLLKRGISIIFGVLFSLVFLHILHIFLAMVYPSIF